MTIVFNLLCKTFITILDILLLDFYLKNIFPNIYQEKAKNIICMSYIFIFIGSMFSMNFRTNIYIYIIFFIILTLILHKWRIPIISCVRKLVFFIGIKLIIYYVTNLSFSWIFNTTISNDYIYYSAPYVLLTQCIYQFICYIIFNLKFYSKNILNLKNFKILSIILFTYFSLTFIIKNPILFRIVSIGRTYIFTVMISIIALICFDRMQTKYEKDKHLQESIIQNLEKEKEFNQQREQQQKEIRKINHNLNNILIILQSHLEKEEYEEAKDYIEQNLKTHVEAYQALTHTGIAAIDGALNAHIQSIKEKGIQYDEDISKILHLGSIVPGDLALIISLALDNAKEACENIEGEKHISLKLQSKQTHVILYIENSIPEGSHPTFHKTSKKDKIAHGFGVSSIKEMAERYHGEAKYEVEHDQVILRVVLQK